MLKLSTRCHTRCLQRRRGAVCSPPSRLVAAAHRSPKTPSGGAHLPNPAPPGAIAGMAAVAACASVAKCGVCYKPHADVQALMCPDDVCDDCGLVPCDDCFMYTRHCDQGAVDIHKIFCGRCLDADPARVRNCDSCNGDFCELPFGGVRPRGCVAHACARWLSALTRVRTRNSARSASLPACSFRVRAAHRGCVPLVSPFAKAGARVARIACGAGLRCFRSRRAGRRTSRCAAVTPSCRQEGTLLRHSGAQALARSGAAAKAAAERALRALEEEEKRAAAGRATQQQRCAKRPLRAPKRARVMPDGLARRNRAKKDRERAKKAAQRAAEQGVAPAEVPVVVLEAVPALPPAPPRVPPPAPVSAAEPVHLEQLPPAPPALLEIFAAVAPASAAAAAAAESSRRPVPAPIKEALTRSAPRPTLSYAAAANARTRSAAAASMQLAPMPTWSTPPAQSLQLVPAASIATQLGAMRLAVAPPAAAAPVPQAVPRAEAQRACVICLDAAPCVVLMPCRHQPLCAAPECLATLRGRCPICREAVADTITVFLL